ncbi:phosphoenolpyruvate--protein phosphotransferase [Aldersonia sp. NBC_00410]|uniref:phosphoenolpyruvate--protein phosphotransferase n=1 Tax=Aldersonia sp. NBC_00410 TaxID=2975954 RepID=UPI002257D76B|nr:phosphoenolpyruvate--protein phosphotransferase [Aldersonia sp. NBC_00410]MCX5045929.1 phosphoenolpyruvate--protein phosphotransferase [Aldersonia sp. NBC_00410]
MSSSVRVPMAKLVLQGTPVVPGVVAAPVIRPGARLRPAIDTTEIAEDARDAERDAFRRAADAVAHRLRDRAGSASGAAAEVLAANAAMAEDRGWRSAVEKLIGSGSGAVSAAVAATEQFAAMFTKLGGLMAERVTDLHDVRDRVVADLLGVPEPGVPTPDVPSVLLAEDLAPADTAGLDPALIVGLATTLGGPTSHTAIIARQLGIPAIVAVSGLENIDDGVFVLLDGTAGEVRVAPDRDLAAAAVAEYRKHAERTASWRGPGATSDGHAVDVLANVQDGAGARTAAQTPAEGIGLFRTELCFLNRETEPSVEEQTRIYREVLDAYPGAKVVVRTLDAGSDKPLKFADHPDEANPALGVRGIRIAAGNPSLLDRQLDAIAAAATDTERRPWVMAPMISTPAEAAAFAAKVRSRDLVPGVMIEVPAAALLADKVLAHVEFLSIGTNDLAQYTMAADRMSADLASLTDPWQPAVLTLVARTAEAGVAAGKPVGVCGEAAADPLLACVLVGFGITSLSAAASAVAAVGAKLGSVTLGDCRAAAAAVLETADAASARAAARKVLG